MSKQTWKPGNMLYPVPAVMVSCQREGEKPNIITVAWAGTICSDPAMVSISVRKERYSHDIIKDSGEFVVNLTTRKLCYATDYCGVKSGKNTDKFADMHLTPQQSVKIAAPAIKESPVNIECKVKDIIELGSHDMFIAEVVAVNVDEKLLDSKGALRLQNPNPPDSSTVLSCRRLLPSCTFEASRIIRLKECFLWYVRLKRQELTTA